MTANDKTGEKLVASMRKTKAAAADKKGGASQSATSSSSKKKTQPRPKAKSVAQRADGNHSRGRDPYQSGRRIWPD